MMVKRFVTWSYLAEIQEVVKTCFLIMGAFDPIIFVLLNHVTALDICHGNFGPIVYTALVLSELDKFKMTCIILGIKSTPIYC